MSTILKARMAVEEAKDALLGAREALRKAAEATPAAATGLHALADAADGALDAFRADVVQAFDHGTLQASLAGTQQTGRRTVVETGSYPLPFTI